MSRGVGEIEVLQSLLGPFVPVFVLVTLLGSLPVYFTVFSICYWLGDRTPLVGDGLAREDVALVVALGFGGLATMTILKSLLAMPRPPGADEAIVVDGLAAPLRSLLAEASTADGYGVPSGHAVGSTVVYGSFAWLRARAGQRRALPAAAVLVGAIALSRVVIGVHYGVDVIAGIVVGVAWLAVAFRIAPTPRRAFPLAAGVAGVGLLVVGPTEYLVLAFGWALGAAVAWWWLAPAIPARPDSTREVWAAVGLGVVFALVPFGVVAALEPTVPVELVANTVILVGLLAVPALADRLVGTTGQTAG